MFFIVARAKSIFKREIVNIIEMVPWYICVWPVVNLYVSVNMYELASVIIKVYTS